MKQLIQTLKTPKGYITCFTIAILIAAALAYMYISSFTNVTFHFDSSKGSILLTDSAKKTYTPTSDLQMRLKKGEYTLAEKGNNLANNTRIITIDNKSSEVAIDFSYTKQYLQSLYENEQLAIYAAILQVYPKIQSDYTISGGRLYGQGNWFGAALVYNNRQSDNRDTLRIIVEKQDDTWEVISTPPTPILSTKTYPNVPYGILKAINQVK